MPTKSEFQAKRVFETLNEGIGIPSTFIRTEVIRMLQLEQEKAVALLETSPLLSYLFFSYVISAKTAPDSPVSDHSEELSALKMRSEKLESELAAAQMALTQAHDLVESLREEVQQLRADLHEDRSREVALLEKNGKEKEDLRKEAQKYKSESDALQRAAANHQLEMARTKQQHNADKAALQTRLDELQRHFDELSRRQEAVAAPIAIVPEESVTDERFPSPERPSLPAKLPQQTPQALVLVESPTVQRPGTPEAAPPDPPTRQAPSTPADTQTPDQPSSPARSSRAQKFKAKRAAKKRAQETQEETGTYLARADVAIEQWQ